VFLLSGAKQQCWRTKRNVHNPSNDLNHDEASACVRARVCVFSFVYTGHRLWHMSQIIGLCYVAGRRACNGGLSSPWTSLIVEPKRRSSHFVFRRRSSLGPSSSLPEHSRQYRGKHLEQQLFVGPHPSPLVRSHQLSTWPYSVTHLVWPMPSERRARHEGKSEDDEAMSCLPFMYAHTLPDSEVHSGV
jgi:hypothetical protein